MNRWWIVLLLLLSLGVNLGVVGILVFDKAHHPRREPPPPPPAQAAQEMAELGGGGDLIAKLPRFADYLGLEGKGRQAFLDIQVSLFQTTTRLRLRLAEIHRDLRRELTGEAPDAARAGRLVHDASDVYLQMETAFTDSVLASRKLLDGTQEQRYVQVLSRLRAAARGQLGMAPTGDDGGPMGGGQEPGPPLGQRPGARFRQGPGGGALRPDGPLPPGWQNRPLQGQRLQQRLEWRRMQRERLLDGQRRPPRAAPPPPAPPPPVY